MVATFNRPDPMVMAGSDRFRSLGVPNNKCSVVRVDDDHAHMIDLQFDDRRLYGIVVKSTQRAYAVEIVKTKNDRCLICDPKPLVLPGVVKQRDDLADKRYTITVERAGRDIAKDYYGYPGRDEHADDMVIVERHNGRLSGVCCIQGRDGIGDAYEDLVRAAKGSAHTYRAEYVPAEQ